MHRHTTSRISLDIPTGFVLAAGPLHFILSGNGVMVSMVLVSPGTVPVLALFASKGAEELRSQLRAGGMATEEIELTIRAADRQLRQTDVEASPVEFGGVVGSKYAYRPKAPGVPEVIHYALDAPGGHVHVTVTLLASSDYRAVESVLHTLRVTPE